MLKVSSHSVRALVVYLSHLGLPLRQSLDLVGLDKASLFNEHSLLSTDVLEALYNHAESVLGLNDIGFNFGQSIEPDRWSTLGYIAYTAPTLNRALQQQYKFQSLVGNLGSPVLKQTNDQTVITWVPAYACSHHTVEEIITGWVALARKLSAAPVIPEKVFFAHACKGDERVYERYFQCPVLFSQDASGVVVDTELLQVPLIKHEPQLHELLCQHAEQQLASFTEAVPIEVMSQYMINRLSVKVPDIDEIAELMNLSVRTLQRKLSDAGTSYSQLLDNLRKQMAMDYLQFEHYSIMYIAEMTGFSEQSAFQRAFKRWTGMTPLQYRKGQSN
ncbi:AraC family transcriptional regulator [Thalassotalea mangrovi]|uniref:AraC family transcriptional regulator n=1 Tax=Thalassotalea mangrovi TaxID=2572245 RepID=A0A4U1B5K7_9GAMM|nr:AraC family transcriptional regulator [Thalassotalea mangrovi]TKB45734.1 AraC family transcriptional regulator [Thalassotalea mangrovi]